MEVLPLHTLFLTKGPSQASQCAPSRMQQADGWACAAVFSFCVCDVYGCGTCMSARRTAHMRTAVLRHVVLHNTLTFSFYFERALFYGYVLSRLALRCTLL
jgi:hypothetical protein